MGHQVAVAVKIWSMESDAGYTPSSGASRVHLVPLSALDGHSDETKAMSSELYDFVRAGEFEQVEKSDLSDVEPIAWRRGVCNYRGISGILEVPEGVVAVRTVYLNISTDKEPSYHAEILNQESVQALYRERRDKYKRLLSQTLNK